MNLIANAVKLNKVIADNGRNPLDAIIKLRYDPKNTNLL
jgi:hypothetical protein